jgi:hypothetical protein
MNRISRAIGKRLERYVSENRDIPGLSPPTNPEMLRRALRPGDVLLMEGSSRVASAIKYLTQSTWSHVALYVGDTLGLHAEDGTPLDFIEANAANGVRATSINTFSGFHCRICRPINLSAGDTAQIIKYASDRIGHKYDLKNVFDLARYLIPTPPVPESWKRPMIAFGSGDPTKAICSGLIAEAFQSVPYPVLPDITTIDTETKDGQERVKEILKIRHHSLFVPRDFDVSPYFSVVKPSLVDGFDYKAMVWAEEQNN